MSELRTQINPFMPSGLFYLFLWAGPCATEGLSFFSFFYKYGLLQNYMNNANSVDPDQLLQNVALNLGLHCLPMSLL